MTTTRTTLSNPTSRLTPREANRVFADAKTAEMRVISGYACAVCGGFPRTGEWVRYKESREYLWTIAHLACLLHPGWKVEPLRFRAEEAAGDSE